jgi:hypothetical protein
MEFVSTGGRLHDGAARGQAAPTSGSRSGSWRSARACEGRGATLSLPCGLVPYLYLQKGAAAPEPEIPRVDP